MRTIAPRRTGRGYITRGRGCTVNAHRDGLVRGEGNGSPSPPARTYRLRDGENRLGLVIYLVVAVVTTKRKTERPVTRRGA